MRRGEARAVTPHDGRAMPRGWFASRAAALALLACVVIGARGAAQAAGRGVVFAGVVRDSAGARVPRVDVEVNDVHAVADDSGTFRLSSLPSGVLTLQVRRLGYRPYDTTLTASPNAELRIAVTLVAAPALLEALAVHDDSRRGKMGAFNTRRARGVGVFITREDIEHRRPGRTSELLRYVSGLYVPQENSDMQSAEIGMRRASRLTAQSNCAVRLYVDGQPYPDGHVDDFRPVEVEGIEIYRSASEVPASFRGRDTMCGVISIWTRDPARRPPADSTR